MKGPIYEPAGRAGEYAALALNIYTGCPHRCYYCYAPRTLHRTKENFHTCVEPRKDIVKKTADQIEREHMTGKLVHLCFLCDPYPTGYDSTPTREIIKLLKAAGNNVQILTKGDGRRDFDLLGAGDWYGITLDGTQNEESEAYRVRVDSIREARARGIKTWVSLEPITNEKQFFYDLQAAATWADKVKIGKLNYYPSDINWHALGGLAESFCKEWGVDYYIKDDLRAEMEKGVQ